MARRSRIDGLPDEVRRWLERALADSRFSGYQALEEMLRERGYAISKSAIHRYGQKIERRFAAIKASTEAARLLVEAADDAQDSRSEAVIAMVQSEMFESIFAIQESEDPNITPVERLDMMSRAAKNIATLARASVNQKRHRLDLQEKLKARLSELESEARAGQSGLDLATVQRISKDVYGLL
ncbi:MAG: DUF3486 family protein [Desulfobulbus sp.]|nr:DUF3486 family protein [Desulfobulbus sp.]